MGEKKKAATAGHQALYRKYRSKKLSEVIGQEHITKTLENALKTGKISHAYLFTGPRGTGKTSIARIIAHELNDLPYNDGETHLDIVEIDAASNRRIDDIRDLRDKVHIAPVSAKYKVYIIDEVHMLTTESFNALLKTLEEPPEHVIFMLATTEVHKLPATIISRTQRHSLRLVSPEKVAVHLAFIAKQEGFEISDEALQLLAEHGGGSFRDSISLLDQMGTSGEPVTRESVELLLGLAPQELLDSLLVAVQQGDWGKILSLLAKLQESGLTPSGIATQLTQSLRKSVKNGSYDTSSVDLMKELLSVQNAQYPQLKLETILLGVKPPQSNISTTVEPQPIEQTEDKPHEEATEKKPKTKDEVKEEKKKETPSPKNTEAEISDKPAVKKQASTSNADITEHWAEVLTAIKKENNSLYTVMRLATPELDDEGLLLIFSFPFHQKKVEESRHKALISDVITTTTGLSVPVRSIVDKTRVKPLNTNPDSTPTNPAHASLISNVQDIMGGGEVVDV